MPALENPQHEEFARLVAAGASKVDAFDRTFPGAERRAARDKGALLAQQPEVEERIIELLEEGADEAVWSLAERLEYLRKVALTSHAELDEHSPVCKGVRWTAQGPEYKMPDKLAALALYNKLAGDAEAGGRGRDLMRDLIATIRSGKWDQRAAQKKKGNVLENTRHERFAQLVSSGERAAYAYEKIYGVSRESARLEGYRLTQRPEVAARLSELRRAGAALVGWTRSMRLHYLRGLAETPIGHIGEDSPYCQGLHRTPHGDHVKTPNKIRAIALYSQLAGAQKAQRPQTIEAIVTRMRKRGEDHLADTTERSLVSFLTSSPR